MWIPENQRILTEDSSDVVRPPEMDIRPPEKTLGHQTPTDGGKDGIKTSIELDRISVGWNLGHQGPQDGESGEWFAEQ